MNIFSFTTMFKKSSAVDKSKCVVVDIEGDQYKLKGLKENSLLFFNYDEHVCPVTWESYDAWLRCGSDKISPIKQYLFLSLTSKCNLDIRGKGLGPVWDTPPFLEIL